MQGLIQALRISGLGGRHSITQQLGVIKLWCSSSLMQGLIQALRIRRVECHSITQHIGAIKLWCSSSLMQGLI